ncbi:hypothetical protein [Spongiibacter sp. IMCC21906]|uniref:hypothetical protein n=1 Tax=Spongiibacter sp. IMCC21906 TaxID=1620392 RepID=UPI00062E838C|nr:hypothetical protein [Spongiibacter sp. IMCC21906]
MSQRKTAAPCWDGLRVASAVPNAGVKHQYVKKERIIKHLILGISVLLFGLFIGSVGVASAGIGIGIPMIPLGIYLSYRGWRIYKHEEETHDSNILNPEALEPLEKTKMGKVGLGILFILVGVGTSAQLIGIPILGVGLWFIYKAYEVEIKKMLKK